MIDARVSPFSTRRTSRLTPWLAAMAPSVSPETTVYGAPATADPAPAGAGTAGVAGAASAWPAADWTAVDWTAAAAPVAAWLADVPGVSGAWAPAWAGAPAPKRRQEATAAAAAGFATVTALDLREYDSPCRAMEVVGVARWRAAVDLRDMVVCLSHACGVSCRVRMGVT